VQGKIVIVTGANTGIGKVTARELARKGATVVMVARNQIRGEAAVAEVKAATGSKLVHLLNGDMSSQASIRALAAEFRARFDRLDVLVNNAGATHGQRSESPDGIEMTFALNHLGYFLLTHLLLDLLKASAPARIICVASEAHRFGTINLDDPEFKRRPYREWPAYSQSKLANIMFTYELARRLEGTNVTVNALHPGTVRTEFFDRMTGIMKVFAAVLGPFLITPDQGAATTIFLASSPEIEGVSGKYFEKQRPRASSAASMDRQVAQRLWAISEELTGITF